ncbi:hypothetical protein MTR_8g070850 [Medicago truncatula]|uniref:Uncharacterized protein n=1 Tax=Medicago truncatula TaxID=3880 RepID=A0A072U375_MEDTR|nr:hypothetical protein MTR_8g070850 [Medicago truncatula]
MAAKHNPMKILSAMEIEDEMKKGLCFVCDEPFILDHAKSISFVVVEMDEENDTHFSKKFQPEASSEEGLKHFTSLLKTHYKTNVYSLSLVLSICFNTLAMTHGKQVHGIIVPYGFVGNKNWAMSYKAVVDNDSRING